MRWRAGHLEHWPAHRARLTRSLESFGRPSPPWSTIRERADTLVAEPAREHRLRLTVPFIAGGRDGWTLVASPMAPSMLTRRRGIHAVTCRAPVPDPGSSARHKLLSRLRALAAVQAGNSVPETASEPLLVDDRGDVLEGATWNVFAVLDGVLVTPPTTAPLLPGVMRSLVLAAARHLGFATSERPLARAGLTAASEVFVTNALLPLAPLCSLDGERLPPPAPGSVHSSRSSMRLRRPDSPEMSPAFGAFARCLGDVVRVVSALSLLNACGGVDEVRSEGCDPLADTGCPSGEHCRLGEDGRTLCLAPESAVGPECTPGSCAPGEACARVEGYPACRALCRLDDGRCPADAVCGYGLDETYGLCVSACQPFPTAPGEACPGGACAPILSLPFPVCVGLGPGRLGDDCRERRCGRALACLSADDGVLCRALCRLGEDDLCPPPQICSGEVAERALGYCRAPEDAGVR